ncbi:MAG: NAD(P)/FAD-dependent oxidoreductase [Chitinophagaceae bacterium]|nr:NAD(P)/FAD-dependent oxidoreductase [Oligoflexus sp.]
MENPSQIPTNDVTRRGFFTRVSAVLLGTLVPHHATASESLKNLESKKPWEPHKKKKIVVIGSGIGGMASGALFAVAGHQVTVLEMHTSLGGHGRHVVRDGLKFSMGPQYVWDFYKDAIGDRFINHLNIADQTPFVKMDPDGFETVLIQQDSGEAIRYAVPLGLPRFRDSLGEHFPKERTQINRFFNDMIEITDALAFITDQLSFKGDWKAYVNVIFGTKVRISTKLKLARALLTDLEKWFDDYKLSKTVRVILYGHGGIFAECEKDLSALVYMSGTSYYHRGSHYPKYGFDVFFDQLRHVIEKNGGKVLTGKKATAISVRENKADRVKCADGSQYNCDAIFSNIAPRLTSKILPEDFQESFTYSPSNTISVCMFGFDGNYERISEMKGKNFWWLDSTTPIDYENVDLNASPKMMYITSHTANGFGKVDPEANLSSLTVFVPNNFMRESAIQYSGGDAEERFKTETLEHTLALIDKEIFPGIANHLNFSEIMTSLELHKETDSERGNIYGRRLTIKEHIKLPIHSFPVENIYSINATTGGPGIARGIQNAAVLLKDLTAQVI